MFADPQFWVAIAFVIFLLAIFNPVRKILISSLDLKINEIKKNIEEAENLKSETQDTLSDIKKRQNDVKVEIELINSESKEKIKILETRAQEKLQENINKRELLAKAKIEQITRDANTMIQEHITDTAISASLKLLEKKLNPEEKQNLIDQSIKDFRSVL